MSSRMSVSPRPSALAAAASSQTSSSAETPSLSRTLLGVAAVAQCLLVAEGEALDATDPLEAGQRLLVRLPCGRGHLAEQAGGHDRVGVHAGAPAGDQVVGEQGADLVAAQHPPAVRVGDRHRAAVGVGVVGDHQVGLLLGGERHREVHRPRLLRVGEGDGREVGVGVLLLLDDVGRLEARGLQHLRDRRSADAVQRRVDEREVARSVLGQAGDGVEVAVHDLLAHQLARVTARQVGERADGRDPGRDLAVGRRDDLAAVAEVDLVAVVLRRVVAGRDHHSGGAAELADREGEEGRRQRAGHDERLEARAGHDLGGVAREDVGVVTGVEADHHGAAVAVEAGVLQVRSQAGSRAGDHDAVHPVRAGAEGAAQASRAELQRAREAVRQVGVLTALGGRDHRLELGPGPVVGVLSGPGAGLLDQLLGCGHVRRLSLAGRRTSWPAVARATARHDVVRGRDNIEAVCHTGDS